MKTEEYNDRMIEEMLEESVVEVPEEIAANVIEALPEIRRKRSFYITGLIPRRKVMTWTVSILLMIIVMMIIFMIMTMHIMNSRIRENLQSRPIESAVESRTEELKSPLNADKKDM